MARRRDSEDATSVLSAAEAAHLTADEQKQRHVLIYMDGKEIGKVVRLEQRDYLMGSRPDCDLVFNYDGVSRHHARIRFDSEHYVVEDLKSSNGTAVGNERIERCALRDGDVIQLGPRVRVRYSLTDETEENMLRHLYETSVRDPLTGAYNRDYLNERLRTEIAFADRHQTETSLLMLDLDHFKHVNDTFGHPAGDYVLVEVVKNILVDLRKEDVLARYGGEEFAISLRGIGLEGARQLAERVRQRNDIQVSYQLQAIPITVSIGCASLTCCAKHSVQNLIATADRRLYAAKEGGRNRVVAAG